MLQMSKWICLLAMYVMNAAAILFQLFFPQYLVEMIFTAFAELFIVLLVLRPEDYIDYSTEIPNYRAYSNEIRKIATSQYREKFIVMRFINARELQKYLGDAKYIDFVKRTAGHIKGFLEREKLIFDMYYEPPGRLYMIIDNYDFDLEPKISSLYAELISDIAEVESVGARIIPRFCEINYPADTEDAETILNVGRQFHRIIPHEQLYTYARDIIGNEGFRVKNNMDRILQRAISEKKFEMYYQPIYSVNEKRFVSAEALIRLKDEEFGFISPALFIRAAERKGLMIPIGDFVLESVFGFISETDLRELGLSYIELNLSVAQCVQGDLADKIFALEKKYHVNPERVNLEITETTYENFGENTDRNIRALSENGFSFSLDDYGTGYSNMQRISKLPLKIIKIDKTLVDDTENKSGRSVLENTVRMMKEIHKEIVCEGVENAEQLDYLSGLGVDFIQGYYFSKPLPADQFVQFIKENNGVRSA
jgi:EAL domain-containing protein (putative c-di-GMP-specific phosphodiesterase class I)